MSAPRRSSIGAPKGLYWSSIGAPKGLKRTNFLILCCYVFRTFWPLKPFKMHLNVVLEVLLDVPEVVLVVLVVALMSRCPF